MIRSTNPTFSQTIALKKQALTLPKFGNGDISSGQSFAEANGVAHDGFVSTSGVQETTPEQAFMMAQQQAQHLSNELTSEENDALTEDFEAFGSALRQELLPQLIDLASKYLDEDGKASSFKIYSQVTQGQIPEGVTPEELKEHGNKVTDFHKKAGELTEAYFSGLNQEFEAHQKDLAKSAPNFSKEQLLKTLKFSKKMTMLSATAKTYLELAVGKAAKNALIENTADFREALQKLAGKTKNSAFTTLFEQMASEEPERSQLAYSQLTKLTRMPRYSDIPIRAQLPEIVELGLNHPQSAFKQTAVLTLPVIDNFDKKKALLIKALQSDDKDTQLTALSLITGVHPDQNTTQLLGGAMSNQEYQKSLNELIQDDKVRGVYQELVDTVVNEEGALGDQAVRALMSLANHEVQDTIKENVEKLTAGQYL